MYSYQIEDVFVYQGDRGRLLTSLFPLLTDAASHCVSAEKAITVFLWSLLMAI